MVAKSAARSLVIEAWEATRWSERRNRKIVALAFIDDHARCNRPSTELEWVPTQSWHRRSRPPSTLSIA